nr:MAG TPA: hypothetical protein [Caudoviricetes sp.]
MQNFHLFYSTENIIAIKNNCHGNCNNSSFLFYAFLIIP